MKEDNNKIDNVINEVIESKRLKSGLKIVVILFVSVMLFQFVCGIICWS